MGQLKIDDRKWRKIAADVAEIATKVAKVGVFAGAGDEKGTSLVEIAAVQEFGSPANNIPERSFLRSTFVEQRQRLGQTCENAARAIVTKGMPIAQALGLVGAWGAAAVKATITQTDIPPPLAPATIAAKGSSKPLVDTGQLVNSITFAVGERSE